MYEWKNVETTPPSSVLVAILAAERAVNAVWSGHELVEIIGPIKASPIQRPENLTDDHRYFQFTVQFVGKNGYRAFSVLCRVHRDRLFWRSTWCQVTHTPHRGSDSQWFVDCEKGEEIHYRDVINEGNVL